MVSDPVAATDWRRLAAETSIPEGIFIGGERRAAIDGSTRAVNSARDGSTLVKLAWAQPADADAAVAAAREAFDHGAWPRLHPRARGEILQHFADLVEEHRSEIALLISLEIGKPIRDAYQIELRALIRCLRFYGELADKESGEITPTEEGELSLVTREPAGVVAAVVPWNFPLTLGGWKFAPLSQQAAQS
jgi:gamma-glutamyl-gamma-aminobutyraldehyde dehydrogenase